MRIMRLMLIKTKIEKTSICGIHFLFYMEDWQILHKTVAYKYKIVLFNT